MQLLHCPEAPVPSQARTVDRHGPDHVKKKQDFLGWLISFKANQDSKKSMQINQKSTPEFGLAAAAPHYKIVRGSIPAIRNSIQKVLTSHLEKQNNIW